MYICFVKHPNSTREYLFDCSDLRESIKHNTPVICETMHGSCQGVTTTEPICIQAGDGALATLFRATGAYLPIKRIIGVQMQLSDADKEQIAREWLADKLSPHLPF